jgi:hypothetical protein
MSTHTHLKTTQNIGILSTWAVKVPKIYVRGGCAAAEASVARVACDGAARAHCTHQEGCSVRVVLRVT